MFIAKKFSKSYSKNLPGSIIFLASSPSKKEGILKGKGMAFENFSRKFFAVCQVVAHE